MRLTVSNLPPFTPCFNPRTPCGVRRFTSKIIVFPCGFQSTHSLRSATADAQREIERKRVSIHALLAECDRNTRPLQSSRTSFNPRTPCGVRQGYRCSRASSMTFQSTHSLRSATWFSSKSLTLYALFQSTHSLRSATNAGSTSSARRLVSIHALLAECDCSSVSFIFLLFCFNPRTPCGVRPEKALCALDGKTVSIHALLAECDQGPLARVKRPRGFNPRTPCGVRRLYAGPPHRRSCFNPRTPCGVRPFSGTFNFNPYRFQSTHSLRSATIIHRGTTRNNKSFNPRTPCGVRPAKKPES